MNHNMNLKNIYISGIIGALILICMPACYATPTNVESLLKSGENNYQKGDYAAAVTDFTSIGENNGWSASLLYDLGNAYAKSGDYGHAQWCYLRSLKLDPTNDDARNNSEFINNKVIDNNKAELKKSKLSVEPDSASFFSSVKSWIANTHSSSLWAYLAVAFFILLIACLAIYLFMQNVLARKIGFFGSISSLGLVALFLLFAFMAANEMKSDDQCVLTAHKLYLKTDPSLNAKDHSVALTRGSQFEILEETETKEDEDKWYKVKYNSDFIGWVPASEVALVTI